MKPNSLSSIPSFYSNQRVIKIIINLNLSHYNNNQKQSRENLQRKIHEICHLQKYTVKGSLKYYIK